MHNRTRSLYSGHPSFLLEGDGGTGGGGDKTFSQADVDRIVQERLARVPANKPPEDYDDLKTKAAKLAELEAKNQTDLERAQQERDDAAAKVAAAEQERDQAKATAADAQKRAAVVAEASKQGAVNGDQLFALLPKDAVTIGDDGQVTGADAAIKAFLTANPHFVGKPARPAPDTGQGPRGEPVSGRDAGIAEAERRFGNRRQGAPATTAPAQQ